MEPKGAGLGIIMDFLIELPYKKREEIIRGLLDKK